MDKRNRQQIGVGRERVRVWFMNADFVGFVPAFYRPYWKFYNHNFSTTISTEE